MDDMPEDIQLTLFRIIQEAFNDISKYAEATDFWITLEVSDEVFLSIRDNGKGFDVDTRNTGIGLINMRQRAEFYNGFANIKSTRNSGCTIEVTLPLAYQKLAV